MKTYTLKTTKTWQGKKPGHIITDVPKHIADTVISQGVAVIHNEQPVKKTTVHKDYETKIDESKPKRRGRRKKLNND